MTSFVKASGKLTKDDAILIGTGSCIQQNFKTMRAVRGMCEKRPDYIILTGDNIYLDQMPRDTKHKTTHALFNFPIGYKIVTYYKEKDLIMREYNILLEHKDWSVNKKIDNKKYEPLLLPIWDDHDYGYDNSDKFNKWKDICREGFVYFLQQSNKNKKNKKSLQLILNQINNPNRGTHYYYDINDKGIKIRCIMLDVRWYREPLKKEILGEEQWKWFDNVLSNTPSSVDWICIATGTTFYLECNKFFKSIGLERFHINQKIKFLKLLNKYNVKKKCFILSGDVHFSSIVVHNVDDCLPEFICSSLTHTNMGELAKTAIKKDNKILSFGKFIGDGIYAQDNFYGLVQVTKNTVTYRLFGGRNDKEYLSYTYDKTKKSNVV